MERIAATEVDDSAALTIDLGVIDLDTVQRVALKMSRDVSFELTMLESNVSCTLFRRPGSSSTLTDLVHEFRIELIDEQLRARIADDTEAARNVILAYAFSRTTLVGS